MAFRKNYTKTISFIPTADEIFINNLKEKEVHKEVTIINVYCKIKNISGTKVKISLDLAILTEDKAKTIEILKYEYTPSVEEGSENFIKQGYEYLKTLPEFKDAEDC